MVTPSGFVVEFHQHDWLPGGFAAYMHDTSGRLIADGQAFCTLDLGAFLAVVAQSDMTPEEMWQTVADAVVHEVLHAVEDWARLEFSEVRVEGLIARYRGYYAEHPERLPEPDDMVAPGLTRRQAERLLEVFNAHRDRPSQDDQNAVEFLEGLLMPNVEGDA